VLFPLIASLVNLVWRDTDLGFTEQIIVGPVLGLFFGTYQVFTHFRHISVLVDEVNEETVQPVRKFETVLDEKMAPAMDLLEKRLVDKGWKSKEVNLDAGFLLLSANKHRGSLPYKFEVHLIPRKDGKTHLKLRIKAPFFDNLFPDLGKSLRYLKEFKTALL
jgi:hypothetical protein